MFFTEIMHMVVTTRAIARGLDDEYAERVWRLVYAGPDTPVSSMSMWNVDQAIRIVEAEWVEENVHWD